MSTVKDESPKSMLTIREASRLLNVHSNTLRRWSEHGIVKAYRIGPRGDRRFNREDIAALLMVRTGNGQVLTRKPGRQ
ncbi:MAG: helix-turn-helix domain-containing protein [Dehalococcoidia bacterium]